jgi:hypothetical protein
MKKKSAKKKTLLTDFARSVGHAAGAIAKVTQGLAANTAAILHADGAPAKPLTPSKRRSAPKSKRTVTKISTRHPRKRSS